MAGTIDDTFEKMLRTFSRRLARLERKAGRRGSSGPILLDRLELSGTSFVDSASNQLTIPEAYQGKLARMELIFCAGLASIADIGSICVHFNGDAETNYRSYGNYVGSSEGSYSNNATAWPRTLYASGQLGSGRVNLVHRAPGWMYWDGSGYYTPGSAVGGTYSTGGRWRGPEDVLSTLNVGYSLTGNNWTLDSSVQLWGYLS